MPTSVIAALNVAAQTALEEGIDKRSERHKRISAKFRTMAREIGLSILPEESVASSTVTAISLSNPEQDRARAVMEKRIRYHDFWRSFIIEGEDNPRRSHGADRNGCVHRKNCHGT